MLIAHYSPNLFATKFEKYLPEREFLANHCTREVDFIYCASISQIGYALVAKKIYKKPLFCWIWDIPYNWREWCRTDKERAEHKFRDNKIIKDVAGLHQCDKIISASKWTQSVLKDKFNIDSEQMYFYIDTEEFDAVPEQENKGHIIQISRYAINKRFDLTIKAMKGIDRELICIGMGKNSDLVRLANEAGINATFYQNLERSELIKLLKQSELLVSPSVFEGWGLSPIEALYCNKPVLLNDLEVFKEVYGHYAAFHKRDDVKDMNKMIRELIHWQSWRHGIVHSCKPLISEFTISKFADRWNKLIKKFWRDQA